MMELNEKTVLHTPSLHGWEREGLYFLMDGETPNWIVTDQRGESLLRQIDGTRTFSELVEAYGRTVKTDSTPSWLHVHDFLQAALRAGIVSSEPYTHTDYQGRSKYLTPDRLREFWFHTNNSCNLTCTHCLVSSHPGGDPGLSTEQLIRIIDQVGALGVHRYYFTGGEPFLRKDIFELIDYVTRGIGAELILLTNATLFRADRMKALASLDRSRLKFQVSLDGVRPESNDPIRGEGTFHRIVDGLKCLNRLGFETSLTAVVTAENIADLVHLPSLAAENGARSIHLMWPHRRGRLMEGNGTGPEAHIPGTADLIGLAREIKRQADACGIVFDNWESLKLRINGRPGIKYDLGNACWDSLCLNSDGRLYPSASFAGHPSAELGDALRQPVKTLWLESPTARRFRTASLIDKPGLKNDPFRFLLGGGDIEHSYFFAESRGRTGDLLEADPYDALYRELAQDVMSDLGRDKRHRVNQRSGYAPPLIYHAMGDGAIVCGTEEVLLGEQTVSTLHSNCVLSFDVEKPHRIVQAFYGQAAEEPQPELCCPIDHDAEDIRHIPNEVLERFYGCGSPVSLAGLAPGEVMVDLGSGGGIDCFIAAKKVGSQGRVIGVDMTEPMLEVAERNRLPVAENLGFDVVEFRKGFLEDVPVDTGSVDLVTSNCVINLAPDKRAVFSEIWRVLKDHGRAVLSDIVSDQPTPPRIRANAHLWGECIAGALTEEEFIAELERAGFYGLQILKKTYWKEVEGYRFDSVTVRGYKYAKKAGCVYTGQRAIYRGPYKAIVDEEGHLFPRHIPVEVCTDTAAKLAAEPYRSYFTVTEGDGKSPDMASVADSEEQASCGPGCC